jgi:hypothetical protein
MPGRPVKRQRIARQNRIFADSEFWDRLFDEYLSKGNMNRAAQTAAKDANIGFHALMNVIRTEPDKRRRWDDCRQMLAEKQIDDINETMDELKTGQVDPSAGRTIINTKQWLAEKYAPSVYGQKTQIDMKVTDTGAEHLKALQDMMNRKAINITPDPKQLPDGETIPAGTDIQSD